MKSFLRSLTALAVAFACAPFAAAQDRGARAELDCLMMANSARRAVASQPGEFASYHHVWTPGLTYGEFEANGLKFVYEIEGDGDETVVVVHGGPGLPHEYFHPALSNLGRFVRLVYFDRRADMRSMSEPAEVASLDEMAAEIDALRRALGLRRVSLLAHSFGSAIALKYALAYPDAVKRLILVSAAAALENPLETESRLLKQLSPSERAAYNANEGKNAASNACERVRNRYRVLYPHYFRQKPDKASVERDLYAIYFDMLARRMLVGGDAGGFDARDELSRIKAPVLVIGGRYNQVTPLDQSEEMARGLARSRFVVMEHSGHFPFLEENYLFTEWVRGFVNATQDSADDSIAVEVKPAPAKTAPVKATAAAPNP